MACCGSAAMDSDNVMVFSGGKMIHGSGMHAPDDFSNLPVSKELIEELDNAAFEKKFRFMRFMCQETIDHLAWLKEKVKDVEGFWASTLLKHPQLSSVISSKSDKDALKYLQHIELVQDPKDPRPFALKFHFKENPYFSDSVLEKKYELQPGSEPAPADGSVNKSMRQFGEPGQDLVEKATEIHWKSDDKNLCAKHPRSNVDGDDDEGFDGDFGSFFHYFTGSDDPFDIGILIQDHILPGPIDVFLGRGSGTMEDFSDSDDEEDELDEDDDDEGSIDLEDEEEQPSKKKTKKA